MKNQFLCFLCLALVFLSCDKNEDLIMIQEDGSTGFIQPNEKGRIDTTALFPLRQDTCIDLLTIQWLSGTAELQPILEMASEEDGAEDLPSKRFLLIAGGDAMSEKLARGHSDLTLIYRTDPRSVSGELVTSFYYGETLELKFEGVSRFQYEGQMLHAEVEVKEAILRTGTELYILDEGVIRFSIPIQPVGQVAVDVEVSINVCSL